MNGKKKSKQLPRLYGMRKNRFRHGLYMKGVSSVVIGELTGIRDSSRHGRHGNAMVHNYWSHRYLADRLKWTAEEYGVKITDASP